MWLVRGSSWPPVVSPELEVGRSLTKSRPSGPVTARVGGKVLLSEGSRLWVLPGLGLLFTCLFSGF